jgi:hypothetical protein
MLNYQELINLAESRGLRVVEGTGPDLKDAARFSRSGKEWIIINESLSESEKIRSLGFLLDNYSGKFKTDIQGLENPTPSGGADFLLSLKCPRG